MSRRIYLSGSDKRKLKRKREEEQNEMHGSLDKYLFPPDKNNESSEVDSSALCTSSNFNEVINVDDNDIKTVEAETASNISDNEKKLPIVPEATTSTKISFDPDPALWQNITEKMREYFVQYPPQQNMELIKNTERVIDNQKRHLTEVHFYRNKCNRERVKREWLVLSASLGALYCWICKLFSSSITALSSTGFNDWKHVSDRLKDHENSHSHREAVCAMIMRKETTARIDVTIAEHAYSENRYWFEVLRRVVSVTKLLSSRGLAFFGQNETIGSPSNGNFLGVMELLGEYDPFVARHLEKFGNPGSGKTSYLSSTTITEFVQLMGNKVLDTILADVEKSKYFSIILDSTPDLTHVDQLCFVIRYVSSDCEPVERFLTFLPIHSHTAEHIEHTAIKFMEEKELNFSYCRGQGYDNASNMAGKYSGLQARLKDLNPFADFVPCSAHSLNLVIVKGVECNGKVLDYFNFLQELYNFFSASTHRWKMLSEKIKENKGLTLKSRSATRWCANADATKALNHSYIQIIDILDNLSSGNAETPTTRHEATSLNKKLKKLETALFVKVWDAILQRANCVSKILQSPAIDLSEVPHLFESLIEFVNLIRGQYENYEQEASELVGHKNYAQKRRTRPPQRIDDGSAVNVDFDSREDFRTSCFLVICDTLISQLNTRMTVYKDVSKKFSCLFETDKEVAHEKAKILQMAYPNDLEVSFPDEFIQFLSIVRNENTIAEKLKKIKKVGISDTFANVETALKIFLTLPISNCSGERSFSLLKRIKSPLRTLIADSKLSSLAILSMESDLTKSLDYEDVISDFTAKKFRRKLIKK